MTLEEISHRVPSTFRVGSITGIEAGDRINIEAYMGRYAKKVVLTTSDAADTVVIRINNLIIERVHVPPANTTLPAWQVAKSIKDSDPVEYWVTVPNITFVGEEIVIQDVPIKSLEFITLTLNTGSTISALVY